MLLKFAKNPEFFINLDKETTIEKYEMESDNDTNLFKFQDEYLSFKRFLIELHRKDNEIINIYMIFPDLEKDILLNIFNSIPEDKRGDLNKLDSAILVFSITEEAIKKYIQPDYDSPAKSSELLKFTDKNNNLVLLNFDYYNLEGIQ